MAETDREDVIPAVLNDLIDVDGTPAEGDMLVYSEGAWRPRLSGSGNGPQVNVYSLTQTTGLPAPNGATTRIPAAATPVDEVDSWAFESPGVPYEYNRGLYPLDGTRFGVWHTSNPSSTRGFRFTSPGLYSLGISLRSVVTSDTPDPTSMLNLGATIEGHSLYFTTQTGVSQSYASSTGHVHPQPGGSLGFNYARFVSEKFPITTEMIESGQTIDPDTYPGFTPVITYRRHTGTVTITEIVWEVIVMRWFPDDHESSWYGFANDW